MINQERAVIEYVVNHLGRVACWVDHEEIGSTNECTQRCPMCLLTRLIQDLREVANL